MAGEGKMMSKNNLNNLSVDELIERYHKNKETLRETLRELAKGLAEVQKIERYNK